MVTPPVILSNKCPMCYAKMLNRGNQKIRSVSSKIWLCVKCNFTNDRRIRA